LGAGFVVLTLICGSGVDVPPGPGGAGVSGAGLVEGATEGVVGEDTGCSFGGSVGCANANSLDAQTHAKISAPRRHVFT
jgi:hypothetical protein